MNKRTENVTRRRKGTLGKLLSTFSAAALVFVLMDGNACCPNCPGCGNNWECAGAILEAISGCCGTGDGTATCKSDGTFCVKCTAGDSCNCQIVE